ncbi:MAG TPA: alginate lyase family protein [Pyrinomonadaceae bacterium]|nr:alginate lyase family protein [Pyrinomonadaceae bacterium]
MIKSLSKLKKLKGRSLDELRVRSAQALAARTERYGLSTQARLPRDSDFFKLLDAGRLGGEPLTAEGLLSHFRARTEPQFFAAFGDADETRRELRRGRWGARAGASVVERARRITEGRFDLLGLRDLSFGSPVDWHLEPLSGKRAPLSHWSRINYLDAGVAGDKKVVWELNRQQYFATLGRAYRHTGDELYARTFAAHLESWMERNPPKLGINWSSSLEVSFRAISWLWALYFFRDSECLTPQLFLRALKFLHLHARHLETYLSTYFSPNTHLTGEALGLFYLGMMLPEFRRASRWREAGGRILLAELERHVRPDGVYFEQSSYYHRYTTDFYTHLYILDQANGGGLADKVREKLLLLLDHLMYITRPDGTTPLYGDDDGGRLVMLEERAPNDFRAALSTGAALFARGDYKFVAGGASEEMLWLLGCRGLRAFDELEARPPADTSHAFESGGFYVMRDGWTRDANYLLIDCGPHGVFDGGHAHADALAFDLAARGRTMLVDPGTYTYTGSQAMRDLFRSSAAHNALTIDGESSSAPGGPFSWRSATRAATHDWTSHARFDFFEGSQDGYTRLASPAVHARGILFLKGDYWVVRDRVETAGAHRYDLNFHFAPDADAVIERVGGVACVRERKDDAAGLELFTFGQAGEWRREQGWVSECYGQRAESPVCVFSSEASGAQEFVTFMLPKAAQSARSQVESARSRVEEVAAKGGRAFEVLDGDRRDVWLLGDGGTVETALAASDFEWAWMRFAPGASVPEEMLLVNGQHLSLEGQELLCAGRRHGYVTARREGDRLRLETDDGESLAVHLQSPAMIR